MQLNKETFKYFSGYIVRAAPGTQIHVRLQLPMETLKCFSGYIVKAVHGTI